MVWWFVSLQFDLDYAHVLATTRFRCIRTLRRQRLALAPRPKMRHPRRHDRALQRLLDPHTGARLQSLVQHGKLCRFPEECPRTTLKVGILKGYVEQVYRRRPHSLAAQRANDQVDQLPLGLLVLDQRLEQRRQAAQRLGRIRDGSKHLLNRPPKLLLPQSHARHLGDLLGRALVHREAVVREQREGRRGRPEGVLVPHKPRAVGAVHALYRVAHRLGRGVVSNMTPETVRHALEPGDLYDVALDGDQLVLDDVRPRLGPAREGLRLDELRRRPPDGVGELRHLGAETFELGLGGRRRGLPLGLVRRDALGRRRRGLRSPLAARGSSAQGRRLGLESSRSGTAADSLLQMSRRGDENLPALQQRRLALKAPSPRSLNWGVVR